MPNLVGLSLVEACETLVTMGLNYELDGEGGMVVAQFPPSGTVLENIRQFKSVLQMSEILLVL